MCGIAGILRHDSEPIGEAVLERMASAMAHRGPDDAGTHVDGPVGLAHRRLAVIDLSPAAHQPMATSDGRYTISYNGEIYNFRELRRELESLGHRFRSQCDTEVALEAYAEWGVEALDRFNGMFALAIWDGREKTLLLARDRYGIKPLYTAQVGRALLFGSEVKAITAHPAYRTRLDRQGLFEYLTFQNFFTERTLFKGIHLLPPGTYAVVRPGDARPLEPVRWWDYAFEEPTGKTDEREYVEEFDRLFRQAVQRQLVSDVPLGSYLSGGMDSGSITAVAAGELPYIKTFTCGFDLHSVSGLELVFDERDRAELMSYLFRTEHYEMVLKAGDMERVLPELTWHLEEPRVGQSYPNYYASHLASKFVTVVLSGAGGDELFGGYPWRYYRAVVNDDFDHYVDKYYAFWQRLVPADEMAGIFRPIWPDVRDVRPRDIFRDVFREPSGVSSPEDYVNHSLYFEARTFLHGLLVVEDKLSMAHSLETRVPFLDNDLVDFAMRVPVQLKLGNLGDVVRLNENEPGLKTSKYFEKSRDGKLLMRKVMARYVPEEIAAGPKQGFSAPDATWFRGQSIDYVRRMLFERDARIYEFLDARAVQRLVTDHLEGRENRRLLIWSLLNLEHWCTKFLDGERDHG